jgi:hypothetical protein
MVPVKMPTTPRTEEMKRMLPEPDFFKRGCAIWHKLYADSRLVAIKNEYSSAARCGSAGDEGRLAVQRPSPPGAVHRAPPRPTRVRLEGWL